MLIGFLKYTNQLHSDGFSYPGVEFVFSDLGKIVLFLKVHFFVYGEKWAKWSLLSSLFAGLLLGLEKEFDEIVKEVKVVVDGV